MNGTGGQTIRVVVAEDEQIILNNLVKKITQVNGRFQVVGSAQDGKSALELVERYAPAVLITDIQMPVMNGLELCKEVQRRYPETVKVLVSGFDDFAYAQSAIRYGVKEYLLKPVKKSKLEDTLADICTFLDARARTLMAGMPGVGEAQPCSPEEVCGMVKAYIMENYRTDINFALIAQKFNFTSSYLSKIFTRYIGMNPSKYLISLRINEAKYLLKNQLHLSVKDVGRIVGYEDQYHFSHIFKQLTGTSPAVYRSSAEKELIIKQG